MKDPTVHPVSATEADWSRERPSRFWDPGPQVLRAIRGYQRCDRTRFFGKLRSKWYVLWHQFWEVVAGTHIPLNCQLGGGLMLRHPNGVVIHPGAKIGPNCLILQQVTITDGVQLGGHVDIGAGAKVIRPVSIGDHAKIGANAVVLEDVPEAATAVGVPARLAAESVPKSHFRARDSAPVLDDEELASWPGR